MNNLLIEIGTEELPSSYMIDLEKDLNKAFQQFLSEHFLTFSSSQVYITPRRIIFFAGTVLEKQNIPEKIMKGPPAKFALTEDGKETEALKGFLQKCQAADYILEGPYIYAKVISQNLDLIPFLKKEFSSFLLSFPYEKKMRWETWQFIRPIRWIVAFYGDQVIDLSICGIQTSTVSRGLRGFDAIPILSADDYFGKMKQNGIEISSSKRKEIIESKFKELKQIPEENMVWENVNRTESPVVSEATFSEDLLALPSEVISTVISNQLKCFPAWVNGNILPKFFFVMNGDRNLALVRKGYEKVITARLNDAKYFYERDLFIPLMERIPDLEKMTFIEKLGTLAMKVDRMRSLYFSDPNFSEQKDLFDLISLCKVDLSTTMVQELTELQGTIGKIYALKQGIKPEIADAIEDCYHPKSENDSLPASCMARSLGTLDRVDTIAGIHAIGMVVSSSSDPLGLRRTANGLIRILMDKPYLFDIKDLFQKSLKTFEEINQYVFDTSLIMKNIQAFYQTRIRSILSQFYRYDIVGAVVSEEWEDVYGVDQRCKAITDQQDSPEFRVMCESYTRIKNITKEKDQGIAELTSEMFQNQAEKDLIDVLKTISQASISGNDDDMIKVLHSFYRLNQPITEFFDKILVMDEDLSVRKNRLQLLYGILKKLNQFADFSKIVFEGGEK
jgi:glycyl-tRNA synthetase beta chain